MEVVYEFNGFIDNGNDDYKFKDIPEWKGNIIVRDNGFFDGVVTLKVFNEEREALIFGNLLEGKIINFMIAGENIIIGSTLIKTSLGYEGRPLIFNYMVFDDIVNSSYNNSHNAIVTLDKKLDISIELIEGIKSRVDKMLSYAREYEKECNDSTYINYYDYILSNNDSSLILLDQLYIQYKGNPKALIKELS